jgi:putative spermidine/putrescine transport system permease protein
VTAESIPSPARRPRLSGRRITSVLSHAYIWVCLAIFVMPFLALVVHSLADRGGTSGLANYQEALESFADNLLWSVQVTGATLLINLAVSLPAAYALVRYPVPGRRVVLSVLQLSLYVPGAVLGLALLLTYTFTYNLVSLPGLIFAMAVGTVPLMLTPIVVALKDLPLEFEEAARCLGASGWQTYRRIVFPLIGPGVSAGVLLTFIIVFNEYLVTLFVHPTNIETAPLRVFNLVRTNGLAPSTSALAVSLQLVSFAAVLVFFRIFGTRHFKGTYIL